jgi:hypothetical protein
MNIVAVYHWGKAVDELSKALAAALGKTVYEARSRLLVPGEGPSVVAVFPDQEKAEESASKLRGNGFEAVVLRHEEVESDNTRFLARHFEFTVQSLHAEGRQKQTIVLPYGEIKLILYGSAVTVRTEKELVKGRKFSASKAIMTQGLVLTKATKNKVETEEQSRDRFIYLYAPNQPTVVLRENGLLYDSLGKALQSSRAANFNQVVSELRRLCPGAVFDDRLLTRGVQGQILGPLLTPEEHLDIATALLAKVLRPAS